jgi:excinuclease UvrABC ATPase subunit
LADRWADLPRKGPERDPARHWRREKIAFKYDDGLRSYTTRKTFEGIIPNLERRWKETDSAWAREEIERYMSPPPAPVCRGYRLKPEARAVKIDGCTSARLPNCRSAMPATGSMTCRTRSTTSRTRSPCASSRRSATG